ncbi:MAG TPA: ribonuclease HII [Candidatus Poseidoniales archaeon]|nr:MAG TPA: ribonuclease HII [Candidatus Poseidoniales archaeon]
MHPRNRKRRSTRCLTTSIWSDFVRVIGVDEAGRGPCIGPLFVGAVALPNEHLHMLEELGVTDSKRLKPNQRESMDAELRRLGALHGWGLCVQPLQPPTIDAAVEEQGLNRLEVEGFVIAINEVWKDGEDHHLVLDACDVDATRFGRNVESGLHTLGKAPAHVLAKHRADADERIVGAASIIAKVARDAWVRAFIERTGHDIGSGYPSDPKMKHVIADLLGGSLPHGDLRWSWATTKRAWQALHGTKAPVRTASGTSVQRRLFDPPSS